MVLSNSAIGAFGPISVAFCVGRGGGAPKCFFAAARVPAKPESTAFALFFKKPNY